MRFFRCVFVVVCLALAACSKAGVSVPKSFNDDSAQLTQSSAIMTAIPAPDVTSITLQSEQAPAPEPTPLSEGASLLNRLPRCEGIQILPSPIKFNWPNIEKHLKEYQDGLWGYYSCEETQEIVAAFYRVQLPKPPFNAYEMNWFVAPEGAVGVFYDGLFWTIVWIVPQSGDLQKSYVIVAQTSNPVGEVCRLYQLRFVQLAAVGHGG